MKMGLISRYEEALIKAREDENLNCHVLSIKDKVKLLKLTDYNPTALDEVWVEYFLREQEA